MQYLITLTAEDYINSFLFAASSKQARKKRIISIVIIISIFLTLAAANFFTGDTEAAGIFIVLAILMLCFFGSYIKWRYKRLYIAYVKNNYGTIIGKPSTMELTDDYLSVTNEIGASHIRLKAIKEITETAGYYFFRTIINQAIAVPKGQLPDEGFGTMVKEIATAQQIHYIKDFNWKFK